MTKSKPKTESRFVQYYNLLWTYPILSVLAGFGTFWLFMLLSKNTFFSMLAGMYLSACLNYILTRGARYGSN